MTMEFAYYKKIWSGKCPLAYSIHRDSKFDDLLCLGKAMWKVDPNFLFLLPFISPD